MNCPVCHELRLEAAKARWTDAPHEVYYCPACGWIEDRGKRHREKDPEPVIIKEPFNPSER